VEWSSQQPAASNQWGGNRAARTAPSSTSQQATHAGQASSTASGPVRQPKAQLCDKAKSATATNLDESQKPRLQLTSTWHCLDRRALYNRNRIRICFVPGLPLTLTIHSDPRCPRLPPSIGLASVLRSFSSVLQPSRSQPARQGKSPSPLLWLTRCTRKSTLHCTTKLLEPGERKRKRNLTGLVLT
jgi:hypothetical protein